MTPVLASASGAPQPPHVGKIIQPQPRSAVAGPVPGGPQKDASASGSNKPVWGNLKVTAAPRPDLKVQSDFPTAAEVAQGERLLLRAPQFRVNFHHSFK
jgi:serine/arginine repetitive matrix protein 2